MKTKDKMDEQQRHAQRDALIRKVRNVLVNEFDYSYGQADVFIGNIWGLGKVKIAQIVKSKDECSLSKPNLLKLAVILQRLIEKLN